MEFLVIFLFILALAKVAGEIFERLGQSEMIGQILVGIILGGTIFAIIPGLGWGPAIDVSDPTLGALWTDPARPDPGDAHHAANLKLLSNVGVFFLVMMAGLELDITELTHSLRGRRFWIAALSFMIPYLSGIGLGLALGMGVLQSLVLGTCISITALPVSVRILSELGLLGTELANSIISAAVINDILGIATLALVLDLSTPSGGTVGVEGTALLTVRIIVFIAFVWAVDRTIYNARKAGPSAMPEWMKRGLGRIARFRSKEALFSFSVITALAFGAFADLLGIHFIIGVFFGALLVVRGLIGDLQFWNVKRSSASIALGIFAPVFFIWLGLHFDLRALAAPALVVGVLLVAVASKFIGGFVGARIAGLPKRESLAIGAGLNGRGIMELIIAAIAYENGLIGAELFSVLVFMGLVTTLMTPPLLRKILGIRKSHGQGGAEGKPSGGAS